MTPWNLVGMARVKGLDVIALTDHNTARNTPEAMAAGEATACRSFPAWRSPAGRRCTSWAIFPPCRRHSQREKLSMPTCRRCKNQPALFGNQIIIGADDSPSGTLEKLLINATDLSVEEVCALVRAFGGVPVPAHINRGSNGMIGALGLMPFLPDYPVVEVYPGVPCPAYATKGRFVIHSSDAHRLEDLQERTFSLDTQPTARDVMRLLRALDGRQIPQNGI